MTATSLPLLPDADLDRMFLGLTDKDWKFFSNKRLFVTGGTGFIGKWLLSALLTASQRLSLNCQIEVLTRSAQTFCELTPHIAYAGGLVLHQGDIRNFNFPRGQFDIIIHAATDVVAQNSPIETFSTCVDGTKRVLEFAQISGAQDFLLTSSGAVYGKHPSTPLGLSESHPGGPDPTLPSSAYAEGKRVSEWLACNKAAEINLKVKIARIYAQVGPYLPMDRHFAIGNFISDALAKRDIIVRGDGTPFRSYLYAADTAIWLLTMITQGKSGCVWNVGGDEGVSIVALAERVANILGSTKGIKVMTPADSKKVVECYVPNVSKARSDLQLPVPLTLDESILRTASWLIQNNIA